MVALVRRLFRGLAVAVLLVAIMVGVPIVLGRVVGAPPPPRWAGAATLPDWAIAIRAWTHVSSVEGLLLWAVWATFIGYLVAGLVRFIRGVRAPRLVLAVPFHRAAASLVGAAATVVSSTAAHATPPAGPAHTAPASVPAGSSGLTAATVFDPVAVHPTQATGGDHPAAQPRYTIASGDWLEAIADRFLGDPDAYEQIRRINPHIRNPNLIVAGDVLVLPHSAVDRGAIRHATGTLVAPPATKAQTAAASGRPAGSSSAAGARAGAVEHVTGSVSVYPPYRGDEVPGLTGGDGVPIGGSRFGGFAAASLLATLALGAVRSELAARSHGWRPGQRPPSGGSGERDLRAAQVPADLERLEVALRHLGAALGGYSVLPDIAGVRMVGGDVHVVVAGRPEAGTADRDRVPWRDGSSGPEPPDLWLAEGDGWVLPASTPVPVLPVDDRPLPTLAAVGSRAGRYVFLDLERAGLVTITGDPGRSAELLRYLAGELGCNTWSRDVRVVLAGFDAREAGWLRQIRPDRVVVAASVTAAADLVRERLAAARAALELAGLSTTFEGRLRRGAAELWTPHVLLVRRAGPGELAILADLGNDVLAAGPRGGAAVVLVAPAGPAASGAPIMATPTTVAPTAVAPTAVAPTMAARAGTVLTVATDATLTIVGDGLRATTEVAGISSDELSRLAGILSLMRRTGLTNDDAAVSVPSASAPPLSPDVSSAGISASPDATLALDASLSVDASPPVEASGSSDASSWRDGTHSSGPAEGDPDPGLDNDLAVWWRTDVALPRLSVLGRVDLRAGGRPPSRPRSVYAEVVAYLATQRQGVSLWTLAGAIWPEPVRDTGVRALLATLRRWLGDAADGNAWLPDARDADYRYRLRPGYLVDWHLVCRLRARAQRRGGAGTDDLHAALSLVGGRPLADCDDRVRGRIPYHWTPGSDLDRSHIIPAVADIAHDLAIRRLASGDPAGARWAIDQAWTADPDRIHDLLWVDRVQAELAAGNQLQARQLVADLVTARDGTDPVDLQPATYVALRNLIPDL
jgi:LysM repeat protein